MKGGGHGNCNASLRQPNVQKNSRALVRGRGLNLKKMLEKQLSPHIRKNWAYVPLHFVLFHSLQPNYIGIARQQPRDWGSHFDFSESGRGRGTAITY